MQKKDAFHLWGRVPLPASGFFGRAWRAGCLVALLVILSVASRASAQATTAIVINYPQAIESADDVLLNVYFTVVDNAGKVVPDARLDATGTIQIVGDSASYEAEVGEANSPIFIALVLDASGSMGGAVGDLQQAAIAAIDTAPQEANLAVYQFNTPTGNGQTLQQLQSFTTDHEAVKASISLLHSENLGTCINYAAFEAIQALRDVTQDQPEARRAVILFTDGYDELTTGRRDTCSVNTSVDQVIASARSAGQGGAARQVPIYTIGMAGENPVDDITLRRFAEETGGLAAIGSQTDLSNQFRGIMESLAHQWVATARVKPSAGVHQATLVVRQQTDSSQQDATPEELSDTFEFQSTGDHSIPFPSVDRASWLVAENRIRVNVTSPQLMGSIELVVFKEDGGEVETLTIQPVDSTTDAQYATPSLDKYEIGGRYRFEVYATDASGNPIRRNEELVLANVDFTYDPSVAPPPPLPIVGIVDVIPNSAGRFMSIQLDARNSDLIDQYRVSLYNETEKVAIPSFTVLPAADNRLTIDLQEVDAGPGLYRVSVMPLDATGNPMLEEDAAYQHQVEYAPEMPSLMQRLGLAFRENLWIPALLILVVGGFFAYLIFGVYRKRQESGIIFNMAEAEKSAKSPLRHPTRFFSGDRSQRQSSNKKPPKPAGSERARGASSGKPASRPGSGPAAAGSQPPAAGSQPPHPKPDAAPASAAMQDVPTPQTPPMPAPVILLTIVKSPDARLVGQKVEISSFPHTIGREGANLNINDPRMSRKHVSLTMQDGRFFITDLGSSNGTFIINTEQQLEARAQYPLAVRLNLRMGGTHITIELPK